MGERGRAARRTGQRSAWVIPGSDVFAGAAEVGRLLHVSLPAFSWGRREGGSWVLGPAPPPRRLPVDLSDAGHAGFLVRLAGLLSFLGVHGLGLSTEGVKELGTRPGSSDVPWLASPPVPSWRAVPAPIVLGVTALRLAGREVASGRVGEARRSLEESLADGLPARSAEVVAAVLRSTDGARPSDALLLDLARTGDTGERVALDLLGLAVPRELAPASGARLVAAGGAADWLARGAARRAPGETAFAEAGPPVSVEDGTPLSELAEGLGPDPRAGALRALARGESPAPEVGPPLVLVARDLDRWDPRSLRAWEELPHTLAGVSRIETRAEAPPPWQSLPIIVPRLGREEISGLVHLPFASAPAFSRFWEELAAEAAGDPARLLGAARQRARAFLAASPRSNGARRPAAPVDIVLRAAALLGDGFSLAEAAAASGASPDRAADVLEEECDAGTLQRSARGAYHFTRDERRRRLESDLTRAERISCLARLEASGTGHLRLLLARLAARGAATDIEEARVRLADAVGSGRAEEATALLARAPGAAPDLGEPFLAAHVHAAAGRMDDARRAAARIDARKALDEPLPRRQEAARLLARLGDGDKALALLPENGEGEELLARAEILLLLRREPEAAGILDSFGPGEGPRAARFHLLRAELHERRQELGAAEVELKAVAAVLAGSGGGPAPVDAGFTAGYLALGLGRPREARAFFRAARDGARTPSRKADALFDLSVAAAEDGELAEAETSLEEALVLFSSLGERDRYLTSLGQRASLAVRRSDAQGAQRDLKTVLAHDRVPGRSFQLLFSIPTRQRLALADGDDADGAEAFAEAVSRLEECAGHPAFREILVLEGARLLASGSAVEALVRLEEAEPWPDARSGVEPLRARLVASARRDLHRTAPESPALDAPERTLLEAEDRLEKGLMPQPGARQALAGLLDRPGGPLEVATRLLEWRGRFPGFFARQDSAPLRHLGLRAARRAGLEGAVARFQEPSASARTEAAVTVPAPTSLVAEDVATREVFDTVRRVASHRISVLVLGESGTGKELVAREVHRASGRTGPFVAVNVAALPDTLAEAELFGAARGAFTGAERDRQGVFEASSGGTLFLDEIGDLSPQVQAKLLRVLQECEVRRLGETRTRAVDLHLVAATHRDLARLVGEGRFRGDLLYRIAGITVTLSPLRERPRDLRVLLDRALAGTSVAPEARAALLSWSWPGNVRELISAVELAKAMAGPGCRVERQHLPEPLRVPAAAPAEGRGRYRAAVDEAKRRVILETLAQTGGNRTRAAALLGLSRQSLLYEMKRLSIND